MTNAAILLVNPGEPGNQILLEEVNTKPFLHYQLGHLEDDFFQNIIIVCGEEKESLQVTFGEKYLGMNITYLDWDKEGGEMANIMNALEYTDQMQVFVLQAAQHFRLNFSKSDDFRRMRDARVLLIGKKGTNKYSKREKIFLNEKGQIMEVMSFDKTEEEDSYNTNAWLISKIYYQKNFQNKRGSLFHNYLKSEYLSTPLFCLACRQYYLQIDKKEDLNTAREDFAEYFFR